jgi:hypothetical protein
MSAQDFQSKETMFRVGGYFEKIEAFRIVKKTAHFVTYAYTDWKGTELERREAADKFFPTWEAARDSIISDHERKINRRKEEIRHLESKLEQIRKMTP